VDKIILSKRVKDDLRVRAVLPPDIIDVVFRMKELRNRFVVHGGMRATIGELFGDPEDSRKLFEEAAFRYDPSLHYGPDFFERSLNDVSLVSAFLFSKMQGLEPLVHVRPGCWSHSSERVRQVLAAQGARWLGPGERRLAPLGEGRY
jgi:hypothetical protein